MEKFISDKNSAFNENKAVNENHAYMEVVGDSIHTDIITHHAWVTMFQDFLGIIFALILLMIIRKMVYFDYSKKCIKCGQGITSNEKNSMDWKEQAKQDKNFLAVSIYHSVVYAFTALLLIGILT